MKFTETFGEYIRIGDSISTEIDGVTYTARIEYDDDAESPEQRDEGLFPSRDPGTAGYIGENPTQSFEEQQAFAQRVVASWKNDEWFYCGIVIRITKTIEIKNHHVNTIILSDNAAALWGIECNYPDSDNAYLNEVANELLEEAQVFCKEVLKQLATG